MKTDVSPDSLSRNRLFWEIMRETIRPDRSKGTYGGIFATGLENSDCMVGIEDRKTGKNISFRRNQLKEAGGDVYHLDTLRERLERIRTLGITCIRFGEGYSLRHPANGVYDFKLTEKVAEECERLGIRRIDDRLHFGLPAWQHMHNHRFPYFLNSEWPRHFADFNRVCTRRDPLQYMTLVNEPLITALFSSMYGMWNEQRGDEGSFVTAVENIARAYILAKQATEETWKEMSLPGAPIYFQNESFEAYFHDFPGSYHCRNEAKRRERRKHVPLDLMFGHHDEETHKYLMNHGMHERDYRWFMDNGNTKRTVLGVDHYPNCVKTIRLNGNIRQNNFRDRYILPTITRQYWHRYNDKLAPEEQMPIFHMEVNGQTDVGRGIWQKTHDTMQTMLSQGYPVIGASWFGDEDQDGWQFGLRARPGRPYRVGLFSKGVPQPVAELFSKHAQKGLRIPEAALHKQADFFEKLSQDSAADAAKLN